MRKINGRLTLYISATLYNHLKLGVPLDKAKEQEYAYQCRFVRIIDKDNAEDYIEHISSVHPSERLPNMPQIYEFEEAEFLARYNLCKDFIAAYQSIKGII